MDATEFEDRINEVILEARNSGLDKDAILSALEIVTMAIQDEED